MTFVKKIRNQFKPKRSSSKDNDHGTVATAEESWAGCGFGSSSLSSLDHQQHGDSLDRALELCERGRVLDSEADFIGAFDCFLQAVTLMEKINVQGQSANLIVTKCETYESMGFIMYKREDYPKAKIYFDKAQALRKDYPHTDTSRREEIEYLMEMVEMMV